MSATMVYINAPLGSLIRYSDGMPKPPSSFTRKLAAWETRNGVGRLVKKEPPRERPTYSSPASFTLHEGNFGEDGIILVTVMRTYSLGSDLRFEIVERPAIGMVRVLQSVGASPELLHMAENREAAELWLARNWYHKAYLEEVTADEVSADAVEGRTAA
ncbi:MAG: hypothetical protein EOR84_31665 [Mesorhizobium sp.]|uniref:hypothetical protein n=1 Tax=Mesorhizobium sp. TaxID=1871066 RepID=UPI000FE6AC2C|nr:hypothetical protein [Mesorhizobium sp.]RWM85618.1 MAG: hypothetical protein EOR84_31665 [Mesorhizobium sp.]